MSNRVGTGSNEDVYT